MSVEPCRIVAGRGAVAFDGPGGIQPRPTASSPPPPAARLRGSQREIAPAQLPAAGLTRRPSAAHEVRFGYGAQSVTIEKGPTFHYADIRYVATGSLNAVNPAWLRISMNPATGDGGTCYGDSGGPNFLGDTNLLAATTITGDFMCRATNVIYRLDTPSARSFLGQFVMLP